MVVSSFFYPIVSRVAAVVLLIAGGLKMMDFLSGLTPASSWWVAIFSTAFELLFGFWLLIGLYPRWSRLVALASFAVFLNVALVGALQGRASCGCFGNASVQPWYAVTLDALMFAGLLLSPPFLTAGMAGLRWFAFALSACLVLLALSRPISAKLALRETPIPTQALSDTPAGIDDPALERVIQGVTRNHAALHTLVYTTETAATKYPTKWSGVRPVWDGKKSVPVSGTWIEPKEEKHSRYVSKTWIRGEEVRVDGLVNQEGGTDGSILLASKGKRIQYVSEARQAWISSDEFADAGYLDSIDLRCAGFQPPLKNVADWLKRSEVLNVGLAKDRAGREIIRIRARMKKGNYENEVTVDFVPAMNCMPSRVVHQFLPDGGVFTVHDIDYQQVGPQGAWFPRTIARRGFSRHTTSDPDAPSGQNLSSQTTVKVLAVGRGVQDEDFDPILPAKTRLFGNLRAQPYSGDVPIRASKVTRTKPIEVPLDAAGHPQTNAPPRKPVWPFVLGTDVLLIGTGLVFRKRLLF